jgi:hypothetical protein
MFQEASDIPHPCKGFHFEKVCRQYFSFAIYAIIDINLGFERYGGSL